MLKTHTVFNPYVYRELSMKKQFRDFESAREFARSLNLKRNQEWFVYCKSGNKPDDIPANPNSTYKKDWTGIGDWLGYGSEIHKIIYRDFESARKFVQSLNLKGEKEWLEYCKSGNKPDNIPFNPRGVFKNKGWKGTGNWLGTGNVAPKNMSHLPFNEARKFVQSLGLKGSKDWRMYSKSKKRPKDIPAAPDRTYKNEGWTTWGDFFGTGTVAPGLKQYRSFNEAREFVRKLGLKNYEEWEKYCKSGKKPDDIPSTPWGTYKEWKKK